MAISPSRIAVASAVVFTLLSPLRAAHAFDNNFLIGGDFIQSDNIARTRSNEQTELITRLYGLYSLVETGPYFDANVLLQATYTDYQQNVVYQDQTDYQGGVNLLWRVVPGRIKMNLQDYYRQAQIVNNQNDTPDNIQDTNVLSVGPDIIFGVPTTNSIEVSGRYIRNTYEILDTDNTQYLSTIALVHKSSPVISYSARLERRDINYDNERLVDAQIYNWLLQTDRTEPTGTFSLAAGYTETKRKGLETLTGTLARLAISRQVNATTVMNLSYLAQYSDAGQDLLGNAAQVNQNYQDLGVGSGAVLFLQRLNFVYNRTNIFGTQRLYFGRSVYRYKDVVPGLFLQDTTTNSEGLLFSHFFSPTVSAAVDVRFTQTEYIDSGRKDNDYSPRVWFLKLLSKNMSFRFQYRRNVRDSTVDNNDYTENVFMMTLTYNSGLVK